jgi:hypothetical protein
VTSPPQHADLLLMTTYFDVRFKYPCNRYGYTKRDRVAFNKLTGYMYFVVGVIPDRPFNYLRIYDEYR